MFWILLYRMDYCYVLWARNLSVVTSQCITISHKDLRFEGKNIVFFRTGKEIKDQNENENDKNNVSE